MWRDFFPNAQIYGADNDPETLFKDERIKTFLCDETRKEDLERLVQQTGCDIDLFIDDGSHASNDQFTLCCMVLIASRNRLLTHAAQGILLSTTL